MKFAPKNQKGFTVVEIIVVLLVIAVLVGSALKGYAVYRDTQATTEVSDLQYVIAKLQSKYRNTPSTAAVTTANAITGNVFPASMNVGATTVTNRVGGLVTVAPATVSTANDAFLITEAGWASEGCQRIAGDITPNVKKVVVTPAGGAATTVYSTYGTVVTLTPSVTDAACSGATNDVAITFTKG